MGGKCQPLLMAAYNFFGQTGSLQSVTRGADITCGSVYRHEAIEKQLIN
jgi:hypothetical protein